MIFIGYDKNYQEQYKNCCRTIKGLVNKTPPIDRVGSTAFTFSRFLVPEFTGYKGWHVFADSDFLFIDDPCKIYNLIDDRFAVKVVKHKAYNSKEEKMNGKKNINYDRKNWASLILWNSSHYKNRILTTDFILNQPALYLLQFLWLGDNDIGEIPAEWNILVDHQDETNAKGLHFTNGTNNDYYKEKLSQCTAFNV